LIDIGSGVPESLAASGIPGIANINAILLTHWHPDHILGLNQLGESVKRANKVLSPIPIYCHYKTFKEISERFPYDLEHNFLPQVISDGRAFTIEPFEFTPVVVRHSKFEGCVVFVCKHIETDFKLVLAWDIDTSECVPPSGGPKNLELLQDCLFKDAHLMIIDTNTWQVSSWPENGQQRRTGHTNFIDAWKYVEACQPRNLGIIHMSGHEDERALDKKKDGYGWPDQKWIDEARKYACVHPIGGKCVCVHEFYQGTVKCSEEFRTNHKESHIQRLKRMLKTRCLGAR
jgi:ribonuclease BN (tRNA processing enzyme)